MPPRDWRLRIKDIQQSIDRIATYIDGLDFEVFSGDRKTVDAVIHNIQIIGEAAIALPDSVASRYPAVPWPISEPCVISSCTAILPSIWRSSGPRPKIVFRNFGGPCDVLQGPVNDRKSDRAW